MWTQGKKQHQVLILISTSAWTRIKNKIRFQNDSVKWPYFLLCKCTVWCVCDHTAPDVTTCFTATVKLSYKLTPYGTVFSPYSMGSIDPVSTRGILRICPGPAVRSPRDRRSPPVGGGGVRVWLLSLLANSTKFLYSGQQHKCEIFIRDLTKKMKNKWKPRFHGLPDSQRFLDEIYMRFCFMCAQSLMPPFSGSACVTSEAFNLKNIMLKILTQLAWGTSSLRKQLQTLWPGTNSMDQN